VVPTICFSHSAEGRLKNGGAVEYEFTGPRQTRFLSRRSAHENSDCEVLMLDLVALHEMGVSFTDLMANAIMLEWNLWVFMT
jgi:hypothetical protein